MQILFFNTRSRKKEIFLPQKDNLVGMYSCGPTVYDDVHIGNLRSYIFADTIKRTLLNFGFSVKHVINVTDLGHLSDDADEGEDKMMRGLVREGLPINLNSLKILAEKYFARFKNDLSALNILPPDHFPFASDHLAEEISLIEKLTSLGYTYQIKDGIYFSTESYPAYGVLGGGASAEHGRISFHSEKKNLRDFALWKFSSDLGYPSPFGHGFPGWHIECSAMSMKYLGESFDIHTGGIDHIPVHHNNEIAQSEAVTQIPLARFWLHNDFLFSTGEKMAKSKGNFFTLNDLTARGITPLAYRLFVLQAHYRTKIEANWESFLAAQKAYERLGNLVTKLKEEAKDDLSPSSENYVHEAKTFLADDLNTPGAVALLWQMLRDENLSPATRLETLKTFDEFLGLDLLSANFKKIAQDIPAEILDLKEKRDEARINKDFALADDLRIEIEKAGFLIRDEKGQSFLEPK